MKRYSIGSRVAQSWLVGQSKFFLDLSGHLDGDGLYRESESFLNYGVDLSGLLRYSAVDDVRDLGDDIDADSPYDDSPDDDIVHVEDVNPNEVLRNDEYWHKSGDDYDVSGMIHRGDIDYNAQAPAESVIEAMRFMSSGGGNVFNCLVSLSNYMSEIKKILERNNVTYALANFEKIHVRIVKKALYSYFKNPLFLENILEVDNIVRDIFENNVNRDTVALFSRLIDLYSGRVKKFSDRREYIEKFIGERVPELSFHSNLVSNLLDRNKVNIEVYLEPIEDFVKILRSLGAESHEIGNLYSEIGYDKIQNLTDVNEIKKILVYYRYFARTNLNPHESNMLDFVPEDFWPDFLRLNGTVNKEKMLSYRTLMPDLFSYMLKNNDGDNVKFGDNVYAILRIYHIYKLCGEKALFDRDYLEEKINSDPEMSKFYNEIVAGNPTFESRYFKKDEVKREYLYIAIYKRYLGILEDALGEDYDHKQMLNYLLDYLPYYKKFQGYIHQINNVAPFLGDNILNLSDNLLVNLSTDINNPYEDKPSDSRKIYEKKDIVSSPYIGKGEYWNLYQTMPYMSNIKFDDWLRFHAERFPNDNEPFDVLVRQFGFLDRFKTSGKILYLFGRNVSDEIVDKISDIDRDKFNKSSRDQLKRLLEDDNFIGNFKVISNSKVDLNRYTPTEMSCFRGDMGEATRDKISTIRKSISRSKNYSGVAWGSPEYNKIFAMIAHEWGCRGRDPKLLTELFDSSLNESDENTSLICSLVNIASGIDNFENIKSGDSARILRRTTIELESYVDSLFLRYSELFKDLKIVKEQVINIGGFNVLFSENPDVLVNVLRIRENDIDYFKEAINDYRSRRKSYFDIVLKLDSNILKKKLSVYGIKKLIEKHPEVRAGINSGNNIISYTESFGYEMKDIQHKLLNDSDNFIPEVYGIKLNFSNNIKLPKSDSNLHLNDYTENIENAGKIIAIFGVDTYRLLDKFSIKLCQSRGLPVKGFKNIPDLGLKSTIIHDLGNLLPKNVSAKNEGLADYYLLYLGFDDKNLKFVADAWNNEISLVDEDMNFLESGFVREFARENDPTKLSKLIKRSNAKSLFENLQPKSTKFALDFIDNFDIPNVKMDDSSPKKILYRGCEDIYLKGLDVPMPFWSDFKATEGDMTLRFLPREDPKGMMLGKITECCQHPENYAASCAYDGHLNPLAAFAVFEINNEIIYQSYVWSDEDGNVCFDSSEASKRNYKGDKDKIAKAKSLLVDFSKSISGKCTIGNNFLGFYSNTEALKNPTETYKSDDVQALLVKFSPNRGNFYSADSNRQYKVD